MCTWWFEYRRCKHEGRWVLTVVCPLSISQPYTLLSPHPANNSCPLSCRNSTTHSSNISTRKLGLLHATLKDFYQDFYNNESKLIPTSSSSFHGNAKNEANRWELNDCTGSKCRENMVWTAKYCCGFKNYPTSYKIASVFCRKLIKLCHDVQSETTLHTSTVEWSFPIG